MTWLDFLSGGQGVHGGRSGQRLFKYDGNLQTYQADLLRDLDKVEEVGPNAIKELRQGTPCLHKSFLLDALLLPPGLFGDAVSSVVKRFQEAKKQAAAFQRFIPRLHQSHRAATKGQLKPCTSGFSYRHQQENVAYRAPPKVSQWVLRTVQKGYSIQIWASATQVQWSTDHESGI